MRSTIKKFGLAALLLTFFVGCVQPPAPVNSDFEVSDEEGNTVTTQAVPTNGLKGEYYDNVDFTGTMKTRYDATVNRNPGTAAPITGIQPTTYSVRWIGQVMPAFSETYTFTLSYADGARLIVNGQVLVNDWVDGAKRTKTKTVTLQANIKYDIRLEYYRNATNLGTIKLEWQSKSRTKQVVPQTSLFTGGSNTVNALSLVKSFTGFPSDVSFDPLDAAVTKTQSGYTIIAREGNAKNFIVAATTENSVKMLLRVLTTDNQVKVTDFIENSSYDLGSLSTYVGADGVFSPEQKIALQKEFIAILTKNLLVKSTTLLNSNGVVRPQFVVDFACERLIPPPPACENCTLQAKVYLETVCNVSGALTAVTIGGITSIVATPLIGGTVAFILGGADIPTIITLGTARQQILSAWDDYINCIEGKTGTIPACRIAAEIQSAVIEKPVGSSGVIREVTIKNKNRPDSEAALVWSTSGDNSGEIEQNIPAKGSLIPGDTQTLRFSYRCPNQPTVLRKNISLVTNANNPPLSNVQTYLEIKCVGEPKISVSPSSISLEAGLNAYSDRGFFSVTNTGNSDLKITGIGPDTTWVSIERYSAEALTSTPIAPGQTRYIGFTFTCGPLIETRTAKISIFHDDLTSPRPMIVDARISCITSPVSITMGGTDFWQKGGCQSSYCFNPPPFEGDTETTYTIRNNGNVPVSFVMNDIRGTFIRLDGINQYEAVGAYMTLQPGEQRNYRLLLGEMCFNVGYARHDWVIKPEVWRRVDVFDFSKVIILLAPQYVIHCNDR